MDSQSTCKISQLTNPIYKICFIFFFLGVLFLPFDDTKLGECLPSYLKIILHNEDAISMYFFLAFVIILFIEEVKQKRLKEYKPILIFFAIYLSLNIILYIHGLIVSPYLESADYSLLKGSNLFLFNITKTISPSISNFTAFAISSTFRQIVSLTTFFMTTYLMVFSFYIFCKHSQIDYMHYIWLSTSISVAYILIFEIIEIAYFMDITKADVIIKKVFNSIYNVANAHGWWPPELPINIRSIFPEPSYLSYWGTCSLIILLYGFYNENKISSIIEYFLLSFIIFSSNSRTGTMLVFGGLVVFFILNLYRNINKDTLIKIGIIILVTIIALSCAIIFINIAPNVNTYENKSGKTTFSDFFNTNINSLTKLNERSNNSRYGMIEAELEVFKKYPLLGAGKDLVGTHLINNFPEYTANNMEVNIWEQTQQEEGPFTNISPGLNEYTYTLAYSGILGFLINTMPFIIVSLFLSINFLAYNKTINKNSSCFILTTCALIIAFGLSNLWMTNYIYIVIFCIAFTDFMNIRSEKSMQHKTNTNLFVE